MANWSAAPIKTGLAESLFEFSDDEWTVYESDGSIEFKNRPKHNSGSLTVYSSDSDQEFVLNQFLVASPEDSPLLTSVNATLIANPVLEQATSLVLPEGAFEFVFAPETASSVIEAASNVTESALFVSQELPAALPASQEPVNVQDVVVDQVVDQIVQSDQDSQTDDEQQDFHSYNYHPETNHLDVELANLLLQALYPAASQNLNLQSIWAVIQCSQRSCRRRRCRCRAQTFDWLMKRHPLKRGGICKPTVKRETRTENLAPAA